jgi:hypothetical protein
MMVGIHPAPPIGIVEKYGFIVEFKDTGNFHAVGAGHAIPTGSTGNRPQ